MQNDSAVILPAKCEGSHDFSLLTGDSEEGRQGSPGGFVAGKSGKTNQAAYAIKAELSAVALAQTRQQAGNLFALLVSDFFRQASREDAFAVHAQIKRQHLAGQPVSGNIEHRQRVLREARFGIKAGELACCIFRTFTMQLGRTRIRRMP